MSMIQKQIDGLEKLKKWALDEEPSRMSTKEIENIIDSSIDTIKALSEKLHSANMQRSEQYYNGGWILCSERLPELDENGVSEYVLCQEVETDKFYIGFYEKYEDEQIERWSDDTGFSMEVIAWMPLPEEYKE